MRSTLLAPVLLILSSGDVTADNRNRDCSKLKKWNYDNEYKRGDRLVHQRNQRRRVQVHQG